MKHKKSYYEGNIYVDTTTGKRYIPKGKCCICGVEYGIQIHHYIEQQRCFRDLETVKTRTPKTLTQEQINEKQKLFEVCSSCHAAIHSMTCDEFDDWFKLDKKDFVYMD